MTTKQVTIHGNKYVLTITIPPSLFWNLRIMRNVLQIRKTDNDDPETELVRREGSIIPSLLVNSHRRSRILEYVVKYYSSLCLPIRVGNQAGKTVFRD